jgi:putative PIN family toxin of toxin-antitoxin system
MKIILDTNIYISAFVFDKKILELLDLCYAKYKVFISIEILQEINDKFFGEKMKKIQPDYNLKNIQDFYTKITSQSSLAFPSQKINLSRDLDDNKFLELAKEVSADYLITGDKDLLTLKTFEKTKILKPSQFLDLGF